MEIYFNGSFTNDTKQVDVADRSFRFGDGIFETVLVYGGKMFDWELHRRRMQNGLGHFRIDADAGAIESAAFELLRRNKLGEGYVRIVISRGLTSAVGYVATGAKPYFMVQTVEKKLPEHKAIKLYVSSVKAFYFTPCKTNNALQYTMALLEAEDNKCENALLLNPEGFVCETATANIFWIKDNVLYTPSNDLPFVPGTFQARILQMWEGKKILGRFRLGDLRQADEIFMSNVGGIITSISEIAPLGIKPPTQEKTLALRGRLVREIMSS